MGLSRDRVCGLRWLDTQPARISTIIGIQEPIPFCKPFLGCTIEAGIQPAVALFRWGAPFRLRTDME